MPKIVHGNLSRRKHCLNNLSSRTRRRIIELEKKDIDDAFNKTANKNVSLSIVSDIPLMDASNTSNITCSKQLKIIPTAVPIELLSKQHTTQSQDNVISDYLPYVSSVQNNALNDVERTTLWTDNMKCKENISTNLAKWAISSKIPHVHINSLLNILKKHECFETILPKDARTLLGTPKDLINIKIVRPGKYYHVGLTDNLIKQYENVSDTPDEISVVIGIDGLPIARSSSSQIWPILGYSKPGQQNIFIIGIYWGLAKPFDSNEFLHDFVIEMSSLISNGLEIQNKKISIKIEAFCCDAPAKSFLLKTKGHTGLSSCSKCTIEGEHSRYRTSFPYILPVPSNRSHESFVARSQEEYHTSNINTILLDLPGFNIIDSFPLDYMHLCCLGVMRKMFLLWLNNGPLTVRIPNSKVKLMSSNLRYIKDFIPIEFCRKPRDIEEICRFKATELRQILLYTGQLIFKNILTKECYEHFMCLNVAMIILISPDLNAYIGFAKKLLIYFVKMFETIYGRHLISHNVHGLLHLCEDYKKYGPLDNTSCFPFENYLHGLKSMVRKHERPLEQIIKRYKERQLFITPKQSEPTNQAIYSFKREHHDGPVPNNKIGNQYKTLIFNKKSITIKTDAISDCYVMTKNKEIIKVLNIINHKTTQDIIIVGKQFLIKNSFYTQPIKSERFGIYCVNNLSENIICFNVSDVSKKCMVISQFKGQNIAIPIFHTE